jgi:protein-export membrane protein SecD
MLLRFPAWKVALLFFTLFAGLICSVPNLLTEQQRAAYLGWLPVQPLKLGLDLKGGASISLQIDPAELRANELLNVNRMVGDKLRETPLIPVRERAPRGDAVVVRVANAEDMPKALERLKTLGAVGTYAITERPDGAIEIRFTENYFATLQSNAVDASREAVQRRADGSGLVEPYITRQGDNRVLVEVPGLNPAEVDTLVDTLTTAGVLTFNLVDGQANPADYQVGVPRNNRIALPNQSMGGAPQVVMLDSIISGGDLSGAYASTDEYGRPSIAFQLHSSGAQKFGRVTTQNIGRPFAIVLDNTIVSAPTINSPITGGSGQITGSFTPDEADQLAIVLKVRPAAGQASGGRTPDRGPQPWRGFDPGGRDGVGGGHPAGRGVHAAGVRPAWRVRRDRAGLQRVHDDRRAVAVRGDADPAGHRGHPADHGYGGRLQRADLRADTRGKACR